MGQIGSRHIIPHICGRGYLRAGLWVTSGREKKKKYTFVSKRDSREYTHSLWEMTPPSEKWQPFLWEPISDLAQILHVPICAPTIWIPKSLKLYQAFFEPVSEKKPGRASKNCDKLRNVQILADAKFQLNWLRRSLRKGCQSLSFLRGSCHLS